MKENVMRYLYYPGCSLEGSAREYGQATEALMKALGVQMTEVEDWTCCGASAAEARSRLLALALSGRNLALAEQMDHMDILVPCSACYLNLAKSNIEIGTDEHLRAKVNEILAEEGLSVRGKARPRHLLDILATDIGAEAVATGLARPLTGLVVAPYYGCQCLRPLAAFDDPENPQSMKALIEATGAKALAWPMGAKCCGAALMNTKPEVGLTLTGKILENARTADAIVTVCPMCQMNLEAYQKKISKRLASDISISVIYLPQLLGLAMGIDAKELGLDSNLAITPDFRRFLTATTAEAC